MNIRDKWNWDEGFLMHDVKYKEKFMLSSALKGRGRDVRKYLFTFIINKIYEVDQCEETEFHDCVHNDDINKPWRPFYYCAAVVYFNDKFINEVKQFDLY